MNEFNLIASYRFVTCNKLNQLMRNTKSLVGRIKFENYVNIKNDIPGLKCEGHSGIEIHNSRYMIFSSNKELKTFDIKAKEVSNVAIESSCSMHTVNDILAVTFISTSVAVYHKGEKIKVALANDQALTGIRQTYLSYSTYGRGALLLPSNQLVYVANTDHQLTLVDLSPVVMSPGQPEYLVEPVALDQKVIDFAVHKNKVYYCTDKQVMSLTHPRLFSRGFPRPTGLKKAVSKPYLDESSGCMYTCICAHDDWTLAASFHMKIEGNIGLQLLDSELRLREATQIEQSQVEPAVTARPIHRMKVIPRRKVTLILLMGVYTHIHLLATNRRHLQQLHVNYQITNVYNNGLAVDDDKMTAYVTGMNHLLCIPILSKIKLN